MRVPVKVKYYDNGYKYFIILSKLFAVGGLGSWLINFLLLSNVDKTTEMTNELNEMLIIGVISLISLIIFKNLNKNKEIMDLMSANSISQANTLLKEEVKKVKAALPNEALKNQFQYEIDSTSDKIAKIYYIKQVKLAPHLGGLNESRRIK